MISENDFDSFDDVAFLATEFIPPSRVYRVIALAGYAIGFGDPINSGIVRYEKALRRNRRELLQRKDTDPRVRLYIERYIK